MSLTALPVPGLLAVGRWSAAVRTVCWTVLVFVFAAAPAFGVPVKLHAVEATKPAADGHPLSAAINDSFAATNGWTISDGLSEEQFAVFAADQTLSASLYQFQFFFLDPVEPAHLGDFGVSVTADTNPSLHSSWVPLLPELATANVTNAIKITGRTVRLNSAKPGIIVTFRAHAPFTGVTGFRLRMRPVSHHQGALPRSIGCASNGSFLLNQFTVDAVPVHSTDIALGCEVYSSGPVPPELPRENLTDGLISTYTHPDPTLNGQHFYFTLDLGRNVELDHIVVRGRRDVTGLNRLDGYRIVVLEDSGSARRLTKWAAEMHLDGSHSPDDTDILHQRNGVGTFVGRAVRIYNQPGESMQPELAELEVYPALHAEVEDWFADDKKLTPPDQIAVPANARKLAFTITTREPGIIPSLLNYRWRIPGWSDQWQETGPGGHVELVPPPSGSYKLEIQAEHTDGIWDESGRLLLFHVARAWWRDPLIMAGIDGGAGILVAAIAWQFLGWRKNRKLALAEQHLELYRERLRIARDMHDDVGARLTYIALLADRTARETQIFASAPGNPLERLAENARDAVSALDNIVWAVNPRHDTLGSLADYLCEYAPAYIREAGVECILDFQITDPHQPLGLTVRHGLLMAVKEALQNVVKHAGATSVRLAFRQRNGEVEISVTDNGRGIAAETAAATAGIDHNGLPNMRQRLAELGGRCEMTSQNGSGGTCVRFILPANDHRK